ncbi:MAG: nuclear transport factor 2 family protein [Paracoccaceae bacterium]
MPITPETARANAAAYTKAWGSISPESVASFFASDGRITINNAAPLIGRAAIAEMAAGFYAEFPALILHMDDFRISGNHAIFPWTLEGKHAETGNFCKVPGWEERTLDEDGKITESLGWFNADEYARQVAEGV